MKDLFLEDKPSIEKTAEMGSIMLPQDATKWTKEIISMFLQHYPHLQEQPLSVTWRKKNPDEGYGIGYVNVLNGAVPVIIEDFRLAPLDILYTADGVAMPLHNEFIQELLNDPTAFKGLKQTRRKSNEDLFNSALQFSPVTEYGSSGIEGRTRDAVKVASVIDNLSYVHKDDAIRMLNELKDETVKLAYEQNDTIDYFEKVANKAKENTKTAHLEDYLRDLDIDRQMVYQDDKGNRFVKQANSRVDKTWETRITAQEYHELEKVIANKEVKPEPQKIEKTAEFSQKLPEEGDYGRIISEDFTSDEIEIIGIEKTAEREKVASFNIFGDETKEIRISEDKNWEITEKNANFEPSIDDIAGDEVKVGSVGVFICGDQATKPVEITGMAKSASHDRNWKIDAEYGLEKFAFYPIKPATGEFENHENGRNNHIYVPGDAKFVKVANKDDGLAKLREFEADIKINGLHGFNKVAFYGSKDADEVKELKTGEKGYIFPIEGSYFENKESEATEKTANLDVFKKHEVYRDKGGLYNLRGPQFAKYAQSNPIRNLNETDAKWAALHCGATEQDLEKIASLGYNREAELEGQIKAPTSITEVDKKLDEIHTGFKEEGRLKIAADLVKEASFIRDKRVVDAVLSLSLLRKRNVQEYLAVLPTYETVLAELCKLLIASRMGLAGTNPGAIKEAVTAMAKVVVQLSNLKASIKDVE